MKFKMDKYDACSLDITTEFLAVAFHNILYYTNVYPKGVFEARKKYNIVVYHSIHPEVNQYIDMCLQRIAECLKNNHCSRVVLAVTDNVYVPLVKFNFDIYKNNSFSESSDVYLVQCEQNLRAFCLTLSSLSDKFDSLPDDASFSIFIHTNEATSVSMATKPEFEDFPLIELTEQIKESDSILPIKRFPLRHYEFETFVEL